ncbi:MAG TPA: protein kinase, partial [Thermoanaerobaculia bacterium]|nr:protein kinase [Thermoanaerobaculia bacterium]
MTLSPEGLLDDKYEILERLASGGMGDVYLVRHRHLQQQRVVKVLRAELASDAAVAQRFQQEARVATQINHPNVAILYDYSQLPDGRFYMVWEYIDGQELGRRVREDGPLDAAAAIELAIQALRGLDAIHSSGVIHRDISPDNLMLSQDARGRPLVKIIDLGLAKDLRPGADSELTQAGAFLGKFQYCSPEQAGFLKNAPLDHRSDLYSLALVLYELLTGLPPFESESQHGFVLKRLTEDPLPLVDRNPALRLPVALERVVLRGLARDREQRYRDAPSFIRALAEVADGMREVSTQEVSLEEAARAARRPAAKGELPAPPAARPRVAPAAAAARPPSAPGRKSSGELSREERQELLAQIERAAVKVQETSKIYGRAEAALREGRFEEARDAVRRLEAVNPRHKGLATLKQRLGETEEISRRRQQVLQAEQMLEKYLLDRQQTLAKLALETLLDLYPNHPKRGDYESWVALLAKEATQQKRADDAFAEGRAALARDDLDGARKQLAEVEDSDLSGKLAGTLLAELREAEQRQRRGREADEVKARLEAHLQRGELREAEQDLDRLARLEVTRVTLDTYRSRLAETRTREADERTVAGFEERFAAAVEARDWGAAREVAQELAQALPDSPRAQ